MKVENRENREISSFEFPILEGRGAYHKADLDRRREARLRRHCQTLKAEAIEG